MMVKFTLSMDVFLIKKHPDLYWPLSFGHLEMFTDEIEAEYLEWCKTEDGKQYLEGGAKYKEIMKK